MRPGWLLAALLVAAPAPVVAAGHGTTTAAAPPAGAAPGDGIDAGALYRRHCAGCHGSERLGAMGPALLPENLGRLRPEQATEVILHGRAATQMPAFADRLDRAEAEALARYIYRPPATPPAWGMAEIRASHLVREGAGRGDARPVHDADPLNLFVVVELGDHHVTILDGDRLEPIRRVPTRFALHGGPKFSPDGRYVTFASRDGWISRFDLYTLEYTHEVRAGINTRNLAISGDGRYVMVANYLPHTLVLLDARDLTPIRVIPVADDRGHGSRVSAVYAAPPRQSFICALKDIPQVWEVYYADEPPPVHRGLVHDYRLGEGLAETGPFPIRVIRLAEHLDDFFFDQSYRHLVGAARDGTGARVINLDVGREVARLDLEGFPHLGSGISFDHQGHRVMATPNLRRPEVAVIDMSEWKVIRRIPTLGPGFFLRSHERSRYAWVDVFFGRNRDAEHVIDKQSLEIVKTLRPAPGKTAAHVEFDRYGRYALLSIWDTDGAVVVYDAATLKEIKRLPMNKPSGKYNVYNKIHRSEGTSH